LEVLETFKMHPAELLQLHLTIDLGRQHVPHPGGPELCGDQFARGERRVRAGLRADRAADRQGGPGCDGCAHLGSHQEADCRQAGHHCGHVQLNFPV